MCDALAVAVALCPGIVQASQEVHAAVELAGTYTRAQTVVDWGCFDSVQRTPNCCWVLEVDQEKYVEMIMTLFKQ